MKRIKIEYDGKEITLSEATTAMSIKRELLRSNLLETETLSIEERIAMLQFYPDIMAVVVDYSGFDDWPITAEQFANELPARFTDTLRETCYELNPHWWVNFDEQEVKKKELL